MKIDFPIPTKQQELRSKRCEELICEAIQAAQGSIGFEEYMHLCLYSNQIGYYESGEEIFGAQGDFTTSPERSAYFAAAFACYIKKLQATLLNHCIVEVGAGSGKFAGDLIAHLKKIDCLPVRYIIIEKSSAMKARQQTYLQKYSQDCEIVWQQSLNEPIENAVVIANEVLDALPVMQVAIKDNQIKERRVQVDEDGILAWVEGGIDKQLGEVLRERIPQHIFKQTTQSYIAEINLQINDFVEQIASFVNQGIFFYIDYGYPRSEYYHDQRHMGSLICHFKNTANDQPLLWPGLQDISCSVDFTSLAEAADAAKLSVDCYSTQAHFLLASQFLESQLYVEQTPSLNEQVELKRLMMPGEMGERFQVMVLSKDIDLSTHKFTTRDLRHRL